MTDHQDIFDPGDYVLVKAYGLDYPGRILEVHLKRGSTSYLVEYVNSGSFETREFYGDELLKNTGAHHD